MILKMMTLMDGVDGVSIGFCFFCFPFSVICFLFSFFSILFSDDTDGGAVGFLNRFLSGISSGDKFAKDCQKLGRPKVRRIVCFNTPPYF